MKSQEYSEGYLMILVSQSTDTYVLPSYYIKVAFCLCVIDKSPEKWFLARSTKRGFASFKKIDVLSSLVQ